MCYIPEVSNIHSPRYHSLMTWSHIKLEFKTVVFCHDIPCSAVDGGSKLWRLVYHMDCSYDFCSESSVFRKIPIQRICLTLWLNPHPHFLDDEVGKKFLSCIWVNTLTNLYPADGSNRVIQTVGTLLLYYITSHPRRHWLL